MFFFHCKSLEDDMNGEIKQITLLEDSTRHKQMAASLNASQRRRVGVGMNRSARG